MSDRTRGILLASCIVAVFLLLRLLYFDHVVMWDEGRFLATLKAFSSWDRSSPFWFYTSFHPPLYLLACFPFYRLSSAPGVVRAICQGLSLLSSLGTLGLLYLIGRDLEGRRTGVLAALVYAIMPAAVVLNVWVKEDSLCLFLALFSIYLYLRGMPWGSGIFLGLALLTKEIAVSTALALGLFALLTTSRDVWKSKAWELAKAYGAAAVIAAWWYLFMSSTVGYFTQFYTGSSYESLRFHQPWHYYLTGLWTDLGGFLAISALAGTVVMVAGYSRRGGRGSLRPLAWTAASFLPLFFSYGKPYWLISMSLPALALTAAIGLESFTGMLERRSSPGIARFALSAVLLSSLAITLFLGDDGYIDSKHRYVPLGVTDYSYSVLSRGAADHFNEGWREGDRLLGSFELADLPNPVFLYYLDHPDDVLTFDRDTGLAGQVIKERPAWTFIADTEEGRALRQEMSRYFAIEPEWAYIGYAYPTYLLFPEQQR